MPPTIVRKMISPQNHWLKWDSGYSSQASKHSSFDVSEVLKDDRIKIDKISSLKRNPEVSCYTISFLEDL